MPFSDFIKRSEVAQSFLTLCDPMDIAYQAPLSMGFSRQEYWSGLSFHSPGDLPNPGIKPGSPTLEADALPSEVPGKLPNLYLMSNMVSLQGHVPEDFNYINVSCFGTRLLVAPVTYYIT